jgi:hypothetical protein
MLPALTPVEGATGFLSGHHTRPWYIVRKQRAVIGSDRRQEEDTHTDHLATLVVSTTEAHDNDNERLTRVLPGAVPSPCGRLREQLVISM